ncbi:Inosine-5'-monophosphate dehydrogenase [subsurface metagenome]
MRICDIMTYNVVTIPSDTPVNHANEIMRTHHFERLPVVDKGKLVGIVTKDRLLRAAPSSATSLNVWELTYLLSKMTVAEIMERDVVTVTPDTSVESAVALAQEKRVGSLPVVEDDRVVGIVTTNDFFLKIFNALLGVGEAGTRLTIRNCPDAECLRQVCDIIHGHKAGIVTMSYVRFPGSEEKDVVVHLDEGVDEARGIVEDLEGAGYSVEIRGR